MSHTLSRFMTKISGRDETVYLVREKQEVVVEKKPSKTHHVLLLDRSGSMAYNINTLIDQAIQLTNTINDEDYLSVGWFSGPGQFQFTAIGTRKNQDIATILNSLRSVVGITCFSEIVGEVARVAGVYDNLVDQTVVTLFTDGNPVVPWSVSEEQNRVHKLLVDLEKNHKLSAFNTIGYGTYYNQEFLQILASSTDQGIHIHTNRISDFLATFRDVVRTGGKTIRKALKVSCGGNVLYVTSENSKLIEDDLDISNVDAERNDVYLISPSSKIISINGVDYVTSGAVEDVTPEEKTNFFYAFANASYYDGGRQKALDIIVNNIHDKSIADKMMNAFTVDESADVQHILKLAVNDSSVRLTEGLCPPGYLPAKDALCVMDVFGHMFSTEGVRYIPFSKNVDGYNRIGRKIEDQTNSFVWSDEEVRSYLNEFVWNKDKMNLSILNSIQGTVKLNRKSADRVGLPELYPSKIYRAHTFIKDGTLNIKQAEFLIPDGLKAEFDSLKVPYKTVEDSVDVDGKSFARVIIDFTKLPVINRMYVEKSDNIENIFNNVIQAMRLEASIRVLKNQIDKVYEALPRLKKEGIFEKLTMDQITVLEEHGISDRGVYGGINNAVPKAEDSDSYEVRQIKFAIKGSAALPSIADFEKMRDGTKKVNFAGQMMLDYYKDMSSRFDLANPNVQLRNDLNFELDKLKTALSSLRQEQAIIKLSKILTNDFFKGLLLDDKGNYVYIKDDVTMILKLDRVTVYV